MREMEGLQIGVRGGLGGLGLRDLPHYKCSRYSVYNMCCF